MPNLDKLVHTNGFPTSHTQGVSIDLSKEAYLDYTNLAQIIKKTSFLETLLLPRISLSEARTILNILNEATIENSTLTNIRLNLSAFGTQISDDLDILYQKIQSRITRNKKRIFAIHGGGYIGLGLMADIISQSPFDYHIVATSSDKFTNLLINSIHKFWIQHDSDKDNDVTCINNVSMLYSRDSNNIIDLYMHANIMAICLTEEGVIQSANLIAQGLIARYEKDQAGLKIFVLMNKTDCAHFVKMQVKAQMLLITNDADYCEQILNAIHFIPTMVDRIVNKIDTPTLFLQLKEQLSQSKKLLASLNFINPTYNVVKQIDAIVNSPRKLIKVIKKIGLQFNLFNAELSFVLYVPDGLPEVPRLPAIRSVKNLDQYILLKNKFVNGPHAILAWLGGLFGHQTIAEAIENPKIYRIIQDMMKYEIAPVLKKDNTKIKSSELEFLQSIFIKQCQNSTNDTILRVGRDPLRKLNRHGCIVGVIDLYKKHHLTFPLTYLERGIAAGILYALKNIDPVNIECKKIQEIYKKNRSYEAILCYKGSYGNGVYSYLDENKDRKLINSITNQIFLLDGIINECSNQYSSTRNSKRSKSFISAN